MAQDTPECELLRNESLRPGYHPDIANRLYGASFQFGLFWFELAIYVFFFLTFGFFKYVHPYRAKFARLHQRSLIFVFNTHAAAACAAVVFSWYESHELPNGTPCWLYLGCYFSFIPGLVLPLVARLSAFQSEANYTKVVMMKAIHDMENSSHGGFEGKGMSFSASEINVSVSEAHYPGETAIEVIGYILSPAFCCCPRRRIRSTKNDGTVAHSSAETDGDGGFQVQTTHQTQLATVVAQRKATTNMRVHKFLKSQGGAIILLHTIFLPIFITVFVSWGVNPMVSAGCWGCEVTVAEEIIMAVEGILCLILFFVAYRASLRRQDPFGSVAEIRLCIWLGGIPAVIFFILNGALRDSFQGDFQFSILLEISLIVFCFIQSVLQCILAVVDSLRESSEMAQTTFTIKEFEQEFLHKNSTYQEAFSKHLASEHGYESLAFLLGVFQWEREYFDVNIKTIRARAKKIVNMYVGENAESPCNLSENCVKSILAGLDRKDDELKFDFFCIAKSEIIKMLYRDSFRRFIRTKEYRIIAASSKEMTSKA